MNYIRSRLSSASGFLNISFLLNWSQVIILSCWNLSYFVYCSFKLVKKELILANTSSSCTGRLLGFLFFSYISFYKLFVDHKLMVSSISGKSNNMIFYVAQNTCMALTSFSLFVHELTAMICIRSFRSTVDIKWVHRPILDRF